MKFSVVAVVSTLFFFVPGLLTQTIPRGISSALISSDLGNTPGKIALTVRKEVQEVNLILSVTDRKGHFVQGLTPSDLTILDNDHKQTDITFLQRQTNLPLHIAFVFDISSSVADRFDAEQFTIRSFLKQVTRPRDSVVLYAFNEGIRFSTPVRGNWKQISHKVRRIRPGGETALYDAVSAAAQDLAKDRQPARKVMILISDGEENASKASLDATLASVLKAETGVYAVNVGENRSTDSARKEKPHSSSWPMRPVECTCMPTTAGMWARHLER